MKRRFVSAVVCLTLLLGLSDSLAREDGGQEVDAAQAKAAFDRAFAEYKEAIRQIEKLRADFQTADAATRGKINAELTGQVAHAQSLVNTMVEAAVEAYRLAPAGDPQVTNLLVAVVRHYVTGQPDPTGPTRILNDGQYERALPIIKLLIDNDAADRRLYAWGFLSAFVINNYDLAEEYLMLAKVSEGFDDPSGISNPAERTAMGLALKFAADVDKYRKLWEAETAIRAAEAAADNLPRVKLTTTKGEITVELFENEAPQSVANFLSLVKQGYYDGTPFHRVIGGFMVQGGAKTDSGGGGPDYTIRGEHVLPNYRRHFRGTLSMARKGDQPDSGSSQFFLTMVPTPHLDGEHTAFGRVTEGIDVLADIVRREPTGDPVRDAGLPKPDRILKAEVLRDRGHEYRFDRLPK
jgi:cyclophilin family peptidyl-prolyl cis-trans isomerase